MISSISLCFEARSVLSLTSVFGAKNEEGDKLEILKAPRHIALDLAKVNLNAAQLAIQIVKPCRVLVLFDFVG